MRLRNFFGLKMQPSANSKSKHNIHVWKTKETKELYRTWSELLSFSTLTQNRNLSHVLLLGHGYLHIWEQT